MQENQNISNTPPWREIHTIIFDFDGVFTDNIVLVDQDGKESVSCSRADGYGFDLLRAFISLKGWDLDYFILSTENNSVVSTRANKLKIKSYHGIDNKLDFIKDYLKKKFPNNSSAQKGCVFFGNDLNDLFSMEYVGFSVAPSDAHPIIKEVAKLVIQEKGGHGAVRLFIENLIGIQGKDDAMSILSSSKKN